MGTGLQTLNFQKKFALWGERIAACRGSGQSVSCWCAENGVRTASYYKWQKRIFQMATANDPVFVELTTQPRISAVALLRIGEAAVELSPGIDEEPSAAACVHAEGFHRRRQSLYRLWLHRPAAWDKRTGIHRAAAVPAGPIHQHAVPVLRQAPGPDEGIILGRRRLCAAV